jgi:hypothetical protein
MDWHWESDARQWEVSSGTWRAIVIQLHPTEWYRYVERMEPAP